MKHVFDKLKSGDIRDLAQNVENAIKALWTTRNDFRVFKLPNETTVKVILKPCPNGSSEIIVLFRHQEVEEVIEVKQAFVWRQNFFSEIAEDVSYEVIMAVNEALMTV